VIDDVVVFGAGGHGKVVADAVLACGMRLEGFIDDHVAVGTKILGKPVLGSSAWLRGRAVKVALGIGSNETRARLAELALAAGATLTTVLHPSAAIARSAKIGEGVVVLAQAAINADAVVERGAIINTGAVVEHDCVVSEFAHISPRAALGGGCRVGERAQLGIGAVMLPGRAIGARALVGGGAAVVHDIAADVVAIGVPARPR
jgi:sugar O-acyltransferase (sialic acid O-acetyltransferase NeuD family)